MVAFANMIIEAGGEGVILRKPSSLYECGKSNSVLKYKAMCDIEALVVNIEGMKYVCEIANASTFVAIKHYSMFVKIGDIVTCAVMRSTRKKLAKYTYKIIAVRNDLLWQDSFSQFNGLHKIL